MKHRGTAGLLDDGDDESRHDRGMWQLVRSAIDRKDPSLGVWSKKMPKIVLDEVSREVGSTRALPTRFMDLLSKENLEVLRVGQSSLEEEKMSHTAGDISIPTVRVEDLFKDEPSLLTVAPSKLAVAELDGDDLTIYLDCLRAVISPLLHLIKGRTDMMDRAFQLAESAYDMGEEIVSSVVTPVVKTVVSFLPIPSIRRHRGVSDARIAQAQARLGEGDSSGMDTLRKAFAVPEKQHEKLMKKVLKELACGEDLMRKSFALELEHRYRLLMHDATPYYQSTCFATEQAYTRWKNNQEEHLSKLLRILDKDWSPRSDSVGKIKVSVVEAYDILGKDKTGKSDPYCVLKVGKTGGEKTQKHHTSIQYQTLHPVWNEDFVFERLPDAEELEIMMWDHDDPTPRTMLSKAMHFRRGIDDFLGQVIVPLDQLQLGRVFRQAFRLDPRTSRSHVAGHLVLEITATSYDAPLDDDDIVLLAHLMEQLATFEDFSHLSEETGLFSRDSVMLIKEFALRRGIPDIFVKLLHLENLVRLGKTYTMAYINVVYSVMQDIAECIGDGALLTLREKWVFKRTLKLLQQRLRETVCHYSTSFPLNRPPNVLGAVLLLLEQVVDLKWWKETQGPDQPTDMKQVLTRYIEEAKINIFHESFNNLSKHESPEAIHELSQITTNIFHGVEVDLKFFQASFPRWINLAEPSALLLWPMLVAQITETVPRIPIQNINSASFSLYFSMKGLMELLRVVPTFQPPPMILSTLFNPMMMGWLNRTQDNLVEWATEAINLDTFPESEGPTHRHSSSVTDIAYAINQAAEFIKSLEWPNGELFALFAEVAFSVVNTYTNQLCKILRAEVKRAQEDLKRMEEEEAGFVVKPRWCIMLNNIEAIRMKMVDLEEGILGVMNDHTKKPHVERQFQKGFQYTKMELNNASKLLVQAMEPTIRNFVCTLAGLRFDAESGRIRSRKRGILSRFFQSDKGKKEDTGAIRAGLMSFLDKQLVVAVESLFHTLFCHKVLPRMWSVVVKAFEDILAPANFQNAHIVKDSGLVQLKEATKPLRNFFRGDGSGLTSTLLDGKVAFLHRLLDLSAQSTPDLVAYHGKLAAGHADDVSPTITGTHILRILSTRTSDKAASKYSEEQLSAAKIQAVVRGNIFRSCSSNIHHLDDDE